MSEKVGLAICEAIIAYDEGDFAKTVRLLLPLKYDMVDIGGSDTQRDLFQQVLIHSAIKSTDAEHHKLARYVLHHKLMII